MFILSEANLGAARTGRVGTAAVLGRNVAGAPILLGRIAKPLDARASDFAGGGGRLLAAFARYRGPRVMLRRFTIALRMWVAAAAAVAAEARTMSCASACGSDPKTFNPLLVEDEASQTIRYLTGGVLIRLNRYNARAGRRAGHQMEGLGKRPAASISSCVRACAFPTALRFTRDDVVYTHARQLMDPNLHSPLPGTRSDRCPEGWNPSAPGRRRVRRAFPGPVAALAAQFDQSRHPVGALAVPKSPPCWVPSHWGEYKPGAYVLLRRNANYWKRECERAFPALSGFDPARDPTESRAGVVAFPSR